MILGSVEVVATSAMDRDQPSCVKYELIYVLRTFCGHILALQTIR